MVHYQPKNYPPLIPYLIVQDADKAIAFYSSIFGATERMRMKRPDGVVMHAELELNGTVLMLADEMPAMQALSPQTIGGTPVSLLLYLPDVDDVAQRAVEAGATLLMATETRFYGDRCAYLADPFGHKWTIATHVEDVSDEEMRRRAKELFGEKPEK